MKTKSLLTILLCSLFYFTSCQKEVMEIVQPNTQETLVAESELTTLISKTSTKDGSKDNILDKSSCTTIELPVTVNVNGLDIIIDSEDDYEVIEAIFDQFEDDEDILNFIFPIKIILSDYTEIEINNQDDFEELIEDCVGENEEDDDIECIDFKYPISFSAYNTEFQIIDVVTIENDRQLHRFIKRVKEREIFASLNFPVEMILSNGDVVEVNNNKELQETIDAAKDDCDEDDDNDYGDDDFTKERLDNLLKSCPWLVYEFERNSDRLENRYIDYAIKFNEDNIVKVRTKEGELLSGEWESEITEDGAVVHLEFEGLEPFTLDWIVYELEPGKIKFYKEGGNRVILKKNCDIPVEFSPELIKNYLQECLWRITRLSVDGIDHEKDYIGTPLKFLDNNVVKIRVNGEYLEGTYDVVQNNHGNVLTIQLEGRPNLQLDWIVTFLDNGVMKLENQTSKMVMEWLCPNTDGDVMYVEDVLMDGLWEVAAYDADSNITTESFHGYTLDFYESGKILVTDPNHGQSRGSWLAYRKNGLRLGLRFGENYPFAELNHRWTIKEISENRIELKAYNSSGEIERIVVLEKKIEQGPTVEEIEAFLQECHWRVTKLVVDETHKDRAYYGTPIKFMENNGAMMRVKGEWLQGTYEVIPADDAMYLQIFFTDRPNLKLWWKITFLGEGIIKMENGNNDFIMEQHCPDGDEDLMYILDVLISTNWEVVAFESVEETDITTDSFIGYKLNFIENGRVEVKDIYEVVSHIGSWLNFRRNGLYLGMLFNDEAPFSELTHRWKIGEISPNRVELKDFNTDGELERVIILEATN